MAKYNTLGKILKFEGFEVLMGKIQELDPRELKNFLHKDRDKPVSQLDLMLFNVPEFFYSAKEESTEDIKKIEFSQAKPAPGVFEFLDWAIKNDASPNQSIKYGNSVFLKSAEMLNSQLLEYFIKNTPNLEITQRDGRGLDIAMRSIMSGRENNFEYIMNLGIFDINKKYIFLEDKTMLHVACGLGDESLINKLLSYQADLTLVDNNENLPCDMIPTEQEHSLDTEPTPETVQQWELLYETLSKQTLLELEKKKVKKVYKTSF